MNHEYLSEKILSGDAIIATKNNELAGFCYLRRRKKGEYVSISGIVIVPKYRKGELSKHLVNKAFELAREKYPEAKIFSLSTSPTIMRINNENGYRPINYSKLSNSELFWSACSDCLNFQTLKNSNYSRCLCSAMLFDPFRFNIEDEHELNEMAVNKVVNSGKKS